MKRRLGRWGAVVASLCLLVGVAPFASGAPEGKEYGPATKGPKVPKAPKAAASAAPSASGSAAATSSAGPAVDPSVVDRFDAPPFTRDPFPTERSDAPSQDEWKTAPMVEVTRRGAAARACRAYRLREYVKVHCGFATTGLRQLAGSPKDVSLFVTPKSLDQPMFDPPNGGQVIFPVRKGEARLFQFFDMQSDWDALVPGPSVVVDVTWPDGEASPTVVLR
jgi:hypothetical protein